MGGEYVFPTEQHSGVPRGALPERIRTGPKATQQLSGRCLWVPALQFLHK